MTSHEADIAAVKEIYNQWAVTANSGDLDRFLSLWADDAIVMRNEIPAVVGKEQLRAFFEPGFEQFDYYIGDSEGLVVQVAGDWAYSHGNYTMTITPKEGGPTTYFDGKWLDVLKKQADGSWKVYCDSATDNVPPKVE